jgi:hypothetical protein
METTDLQARINDLEKRVCQLEKQLAGAPAPRAASGKKLSAKEFLMAKNVKSETQRVLALGYFLERVTGMASFNVPDLEATFRSAKEKLPKNMNDAVNKNITRGFLMEAETKKDAKKAWYLTSTGERYVENEMSVT